MECQMPKIITKDEKIIQILKQTKTIAIVGLSPDESKASHRVGKYLKEVGYKIIPIYPKEEEILGEKIYRSLDEVKEKIDMVNMFRKGSFASTLYEQIKKREDVKSFWLQLGIVNDGAGELALKDGIDFVQNKCIMIEHKKFEEDLK
ncbi:MAG: CoA-binding protein [Proteobacteria bacterium]|nr:MAG: CoA-binding protein [Pseudomonadota bacterium]